MKNVDSIKIQSRQDLDQSLANKVLQWHELSQADDVSPFLKVLGSASLEKRKNTPFPNGDGEMTLIKNGKNFRAIRYYLNKGRLIDQQSGYSYKMPDPIKSTLQHVDTLSLVHE